MKKNPSISVNILNYNGKKFLKRCMDDLLKQEYPNFRIVFIDNASIDGSVEYIEQSYSKEINSKKIEIISFNKNYGFAGGYNRVYSRDKSDYFLLLNNDIGIPNKMLLSNIIETAKKNNFAITSGSEYPFNEKKFKEKIKFDALGLLGFHFPSVLNENNLFSSGGPCVLVDRKKIDYLFPEEYFAYGEDIYLCWRTKLLGYSLGTSTQAKFIHYGRGTGGKKSPFVRYYAEKNRNANLLIFFEIKNLFKIFPIYLLENLIKAGYSIKYPRLLWALIRSFFWDISHLKLIFQYRKKIQKERKISDKEILKVMSYKVFPEHLSKISKYLNSFVKAYCRVVRIKTYD